jgi:addiction module HigA family antidote
MSETWLMHNPPHPGRILRQMYLEPLELPAAVLADRLGVSHETVAQLLDEQGRITPDFAWRLAQFWGMSVRYWSGLQEEFDLWHARQSTDLSQVQPLTPAT